MLQMTTYLVFHAQEMCMKENMTLLCWQEGCADLYCHSSLLSIVQSHEKGIASFFLFNYHSKPCSVKSLVPFVYTAWISIPAVMSCMVKGGHKAIIFSSFCWKECRGIKVILFASRSRLRMKWPMDTCCKIGPPYTMFTLLCYIHQLLCSAALVD